MACTTLYMMMEQQVTHLLHLHHKDLMAVMVEGYYKQKTHLAAVVVAQHLMEVTLQTEHQATAAQVQTHSQLGLVQQAQVLVDITQVAVEEEPGITVMLNQLVD